MGWARIQIFPTFCSLATMKLPLASRLRDSLVKLRAA
jgi:hypothetical protein